MKKIIISIGILIPSLSLAALGFNLWNGSVQTEKSGLYSEQQQVINQSIYPILSVPNPDFSYAIGSRFNTRISLNKLSSAEKLRDLLPNEATIRLSDFENFRLSVYAESGEIIELSDNEILTEAQKELLSNCNYSTDFSVHADCKITKDNSASPEYYGLVYYVSVIPETEAKYNKGKEELIQYLKKNSLSVTKDLNKSELNPGRLHFVVSNNGTIKDIRIASSCGHESIDAKMKELIRSTSGNWKSAKNADSEPVEQELVFFYGMIGC